MSDIELKNHIQDINELREKFTEAFEKTMCCKITEAPQIADYCWKVVMEMNKQ